MMKVYRAAAAGLLCIEFVTGDPSRFLLTKSLGPFDDDHNYHLIHKVWKSSKMSSSETSYGNMMENHRSKIPR